MVKGARRRKKQTEPTAHDRRAVDALKALQAVPVEIENPHDLDRGKIVVLASTRDDILRRLLASKGIDEAQFAAGRAWEQDWQSAQLGHTSSGGQWRERVDGGGVSIEELTDHKKKAIDRLGVADKALGIQGCAIIRCILGDGLEANVVAVRFLSSDSQRSLDYINRRFRECLETLVMVYQMGNRPIT